MLELSVRDGDTLIGLSDRYLAKPADWPRLQRLNRVADPKRLQPGSTIRIPVAWLREEVDRAEVLSVAGNVKAVVEGAEKVVVSLKSDPKVGARLTACVVAPFKAAFDAAASVQANVSISVEVKASAEAHAGGSAHAG